MFSLVLGLGWIAATFLFGITIEQVIAYVGEKLGDT